MSSKKKLLIPGLKKCKSLRSESKSRMTTSWNKTFVPTTLSRNTLKCIFNDNEFSLFY